MRAGVLITNGGPHPPESWAMATAEKMIPTDHPDLQGRRLMAARALQLKVAEALIPHHEKVQNDTKDALEANADDRLNQEHDASAYVEEVIKDVQSAAEGTEWQAKFQDPEVIDALKGIAASHFHTAMDIECQYHADKNQTEVAKAYKLKAHPTA